MKVWAQALVLVVMALPPAALTAWWHPRAPTLAAPTLAPYEVTMAEIRSWTEPILWVDARSQEEFEQQHVPGAYWLNEDVWERQLDGLLEQWTPDVRLIVYCSRNRCATSERVARRLRTDLAVERVYFLHGGYEAWRQDRP